MGKNRVTYGGRAFAQDAHNAMRGDIVRGLIEAITNCDDSYGDQPGKIRIEVEHRRQKPWKVVIRDRATGMRASKMKTAIGGLGGRTSGFEEGREVRGNLGRGAKDLAAFGPVRFESICNGFHSVMTLEEDGSYDDPVERKARPDERDALHIPKSGTVVTIEVKERISCPLHGKLLERLSDHYQLRDINSDPRRDLTLVDLNSGRTDTIRYSRPRLEELISADVGIDGYPDASGRLTIWRNEERYDHAANDPSRPEGILVTGGRAIYENTLFNFESSPYSGWFSGRIECPYIDQLARDFDERNQAGVEQLAENPIPIITRDRDGLQHDHPFYKALTAAVEAHLEPLVRTEEERARSGSARESSRMRRTLDALGRDLGKLIDSDLRELDEDGITGDGEGVEDFLIRVIPENVVMYMGENKTISVVVARSLRVSDIAVAVDPEGIVELVEGNLVPLVDHPRRDGYLIGRIKLRPLIEDDDTYLVVKAGEEETGALIEVRPERIEPEPKPPDTFEFERDRYQLTHRKRRQLRLQAPIEVVNRVGTAVHVKSSSPDIAILGGGYVDLDFDEELLYFVGEVSVDPRVVGASGQLEAGVGDLQANCAVSVATTESGPSIEIKIEDRTAGNFRAIVEKYPNGSVKIQICGGHSALKRYLGPGPEFPGQDTPQAKLVLAEIIAAEAARMVVERKHGSVGELDGAGFYGEHRHYLERYLARCHKMMLSDGEL